MAYRKLSEVLKPAGDPEISEMEVGTAAGYTEIKADGTPVKNGTATVWDDIQASLIGQRLFSAVGKVDYNYDENTLTFQSGGNIASSNDRVMMNIQTSHKTKFDSNLMPHLHFKQSDTTERVFTLQYRVQANGQAWDDTWTTVTASTLTDCHATYVSGDIINILKFPAVDLTGKGISTLVQFRLARTDSNSGDVAGIFFDCHFEIDTDGSKEEYVK